jgi:uncharacterized membrane protein YqhA
VIRSLLRIRNLAALVAVAFVVHAIGFLVLGTYRGIEAYRPFLGSGERAEGHPGQHIAESVDALLFSLVLIVLALGTASLFLTKPGSTEKSDLPDWMRIRSLTELKLLLWEAILAMLVVTGAATIIGDLPHLNWNHLVIPGAILILSVSYYLLKRTESRP